MPFQNGIRTEQGELLLLPEEQHQAGLGENQMKMMMIMKSFL